MKLRMMTLGGSWQLTVALCSLANFINAADRSLMPLAIVQISAELGWTLHDQGWVLSAFAVGYMASQLMAAPAVSRYGARNVMAAAVLLWSLSTLATLVAVRSLPLVVICRILLGLGEGIGLPTIFQILGQGVAVESRSRAFSYLVAAGAIGQAVAAVACPQLPWPVMFVVLGMLGLCWVVLWLCLFPKTPPGGGGIDSTPLLSKGGGGEPSWRPLLCHWPLWAIYVAHFSMNWANYMIMHWLPTYLTRSLGADSHALSLTAMPYLVNSLCGVVAGHMADSLVTQHKWPLLSVRRLMTTLGLVGPGLFLLCFCAVTNLTAALLFVSLSMGLCACNSAGHLSNHADVAPHHAGLTFAISNTMATIPGILLGPLTAELVTQSQGRWLPVFVLAAGVELTGAAVYASQSRASPALL